MSKYLKLIVLVILIFGLASCNIRTPEIKGVVLDEETKQPVEGAWVHAMLEIKTKTIQGEVNNVLSMDRPHTRTDKNGRFTILPKKFKKPLPPVGFGTEVLAFRIGASTVDDKGGGSRYFGGDYRKHFGEGDGDLHEILRKDIIELTVYVKPIVRTESEYFSHLQSLYNYCLMGRFSVEAPPAEGGCDEWELDFAIAKHEKYLERHREDIEKDANTAIFDQLAYLYERKKDYEKAIATLRKSLALIERRGLLKFDVWQRNKASIELKIDKLQKLLGPKH